MTKSRRDKIDKREVVTIRSYQRCIVQCTGNTWYVYVSVCGYMCMCTCARENWPDHVSLSGAFPVERLIARLFRPPSFSLPRRLPLFPLILSRWSPTPGTPRSPFPLRFPLCAARRRNGTTSGAARQIVQDIFVPTAAKGEIDLSRDRALNSSSRALLFTSLSRSFTS